MWHQHTSLTYQYFPLSTMSSNFSNDALSWSVDKLLIDVGRSCINLEYKTKHTLDEVLVYYNCKFKNSSKSHFSKKKHFHFQKNYNLQSVYSRSFNCNQTFSPKLAYLDSRCFLFNTTSWISVQTNNTTKYSGMFCILFKFSDKKNSKHQT